MVQTSQVREQTVQLPPEAPLVRITACYGTAGQKTWNLRRPVTLIGSRRPAHIVLHDDGISNAHCVFVNTGTELLLKDLHTSSGTLCNEKPVDLVVLKDGDVVRIGNTGIQIAIRTPQNDSDDSGYGLKFVDPTRFCEPVPLTLAYTDMRWDLESAVTLVGRHDKAPVRLDHPDVCRRHAVLFRFRNRPAIFDVGSRNGICVNGQHCSLTPLDDGDRITLGPFTLTIGKNTDGDDSGGKTETAAEGNRTTTDAAGSELSSPSHTPNDCAAPVETAGSSVAPTDTPSVRTGSSGSETLSEQISHSWGDLNEWESRLQANTSTLEGRQEGLTQREAALDAREAALRGKLHDVERSHEQVSAQEHAVAAQAAQTQLDRDNVAADERAYTAKQHELNQRESEIERRERVVAQRWSRRLASTCPHCGKAVNVGHTRVVEEV